MALNVVKRFIKRKEAVQLLTQHFNQFITEAALINSLRNTRVSYSTIFQNKTKLVETSQLKELYFRRLYSIETAEKNIIDDFRTENNITIIGEDIPNPYTDIESSKFPDYIKHFLNNEGFTKPTVIQSQGWPIALSGQNFVGIAQTGTGKTLSYLLPAVVHIKENKAKKGRGPRVLILAPTRELARQIEQVARKFQRSLQVRCVCVYGGANRSKQAAELEAGVDIVIATPGRLNDFLVSKTTTLSRCTYVVLDEADRMLDMGFEPQIRQALEGVPLERQILMFSATWPKEVKILAKDYLGEFVQVNVGSTELTANHNITQNVIVCDQEEKMEKFRQIMHDISGSSKGKILVFTNTKRFVDNLVSILQKNGWPAAGIHGDRTQLQRDSIIYRFKTGKTNILVATDVAARGLDVDGVTHVFNYDFPNTTEDYIHRIGRTGRQQNKGVSYTFLTSDEAKQANDLISVLREANQEVPQELADLKRSYDLGRIKDRETKFRPKQFKFNPNRQWNKHRNDRSDRYGGDNRYDRYSRNDNYDRSSRNDRYNNSNRNDRFGRDEDMY